MGWETDTEREEERAAIFAMIVALAVAAICEIVFWLAG